MTKQRPVQAQECLEHHMLLKGQLDRINHFLFGDPEHPDDLSVTAKVNLMFNVLLEIKRWAIGAVFTFAGYLVLGSGIFHLRKMPGAHLSGDIWSFVKNQYVLLDLI